MLRSHLVFVASTLVAAGAWAFGCSSNTTTDNSASTTGSSMSKGSSTATTGSSMGGAGGMGGGGTHAEPPPPPSNGMMPDGTSDTVLAISHLYLGLYDRDGTADTMAWANYGFDLDHKISTKDSTDLCKPYGSAQKSSVYPDGNNGIDNAFGKILLPIIAGVLQDPETTVNSSIDGGAFTLMLDLHKLGSAMNYTNIETGLYGGGNLGMAPKWDGTDMWPVVPELLEDPETDITKPKVHFDGSYVNANTWVSGSMGDVTLSLAVKGQNLNLTIHNAVIAMQLSDDHKSATNGTVAGILGREELAGEIQMLAGNFAQNLCSGPTLDAILDEIRGAADIGVDGTQDPTKVCDGISIGLGFDAKQVQLGPIGPKAQPSPNPCAMGGGGGAGGAGGGAGTGGAGGAMTP